MLEIRNLTKIYRPKKGVPVKALDGVNLKLEDHGLIFILGKSGSGKSTLLNLLGGLDRFDDGEIIIKGKSSKDFTQADFDSYRNTYVGFVFQEYNILEEFTVGANIALAMELQGHKSTGSELSRILDEVDLSGYAQRKPNELSGGQKQRVAVAGVLAMRPKVIVFDESTAMLDPIGRRDILALAKRLNREEDITVVWITHFMDEAVQADRVVVMDSGRIALEGTPREVFVQVDKVRALGLDVPEMMRLSQDLRAAGVNGLSGQAMTVEEMAEELCRLKSRI